MKAQIGYQVAVLESATGEPRANENVTVELTITDSEGTSIYSGKQQAMTNEFGIASLTVGDADTFANVDWSKLPLFISATVDGKLLGKTQILSVPVAEYAKQSGPTLTKEMLLGTWVYTRKFSDGSKYSESLIFSVNNECIHYESSSGSITSRKYRYFIENDRIALVRIDSPYGSSYENDGRFLFYSPTMNAVQYDNGDFYIKQ